MMALVRERLTQDTCCGTIFVFRSKRADRIKILAWDGSGLVLLWKGLEQGSFRWPPVRRPGGIAESLVASRPRDHSRFPGKNSKQLFVRVSLGHLSTVLFARNPCAIDAFRCRTDWTVFFASALFALSPAFRSGRSFLLRGMNSERAKRVLRRSCVSRRDGLARIERAPSARGPYSMRPV